MPSRPNPTPPARPLGHWCMRAISLALIGQNRSRCLSGRTKQNPVLFACELPNSPPPHKTTTMATKKATGEALVGAGVARDFGESHGGIFTGVVVSFSGGRRPTYRIHYSDGDKEDMDEGQVEYGRELYQQHVGGGKDSYVAHRELGGEMSHMNFALGLVMDLWSRRVDGGPRTRGAMDVTVESRRPVHTRMRYTVEPLPDARLRHPDLHKASFYEWRRGCFYCRWKAGKARLEGEQPKKVHKVSRGCPQCGDLALCKLCWDEYHSTPE